jgi:hypothetical protein
LGPNSEGLEKRRGYRLEERYEILGQPVPYPEEAGSKIIMIRKAPLKGKIGSIDGLYRYLVIESKSGQVRDIYQSEEKLEAIFKAGNAELPKFTNLPAAETEYSETALSSTPRTTASQATTPSTLPRPMASATITPAVAADKPSSGFPTVPLIILAAVLVGAAVFFLRRKR